MSLSAQTGFVEFPYNPDSDNDDIIGIEDLMGLLSLYGSEFSEEGLYLNADSTEAVYDGGEHNFAMCIATCMSLPGEWRMIDLNSWGEFHNEIEAITVAGDAHAWLSELVLPNATDFASVYGDSSFKGELNWQDGNNSNTCVCYARERPNVEYSYCQGGYLGDPEFQSCANSKTAEGWYPLGGIETTAGQSSTQAFWRWAE